MPRWIEAAQKRTLERTRRPIIAADIARFGEDETVIMRREGGWIRTYRAHHKECDAKIYGIFHESEINRAGT